MSRLSLDKQKVFEALNGAITSYYKGVEIAVEIKDYWEGAMFTAEMDELRLTDKDLKKLLQKIDRKLAGKKVRLDIPVYLIEGGRGEAYTLTTVNMDGSVNLTTGRGREKIRGYEISRRLAYHSEENSARFDRIGKLMREQHLLREEQAKIRKGVEMYSKESIEALVDAKTKK